MLLLFNLLLFVADACLLSVVRSRTGLTQRLALLAAFALLAFVLALPLGYLLTPRHAGFAFLGLCAWALFLHGGVLGLGMVLVDWQRARRWSLVWLVSTLGLALIAGRAFLIEPLALEITHTTLRSAKLHAQVTVAVVADLQTDLPGAYERRVLEQVRDAQPDLILFCGDYVQEDDRELYEAKRRALNQLLLDVQLDAPLGMFAVRGNVEDADAKRWAGIFAGTRTVCIENTGTLRAGELLVTGLSLSDSFDTRLELSDPDLAREERFHLVFGHGPDFALSEVEGDLFVAGHTHGGQVQLPFVGPIVDLSAVPNAWSRGGLSDVGKGRLLYVSRGIGLERGPAPRLRLLCRPELAFLHLLPAEEEP